jgi:AcrR family transcriptional regulator
MIQAALRTIEKDGLDALSLREVARSLRVSPRAPYRHFTSKEDMLAAVAVEGYGMSRAFVSERVAHAGPDPLAQLRAAVTAQVLFATQHAGAFRVMFAPYARVDESSPELVRVRSEGHSAMLALIRRAQETGQLRAGDPMLLALAMWSSMHGLSVLLIEGQLGRFDRLVEAAKLADVVCGLMFEGLLAGGARGP